MKGEEVLYRLSDCQLLKSGYGVGYTLMEYCIYYR